MSVGTVLSLTFNLAMLCGATPARMNVALLFSEPASWGVFIYDASTHATLFSSGVPILQERVDSRTEKVSPVGGASSVVREIRLDLRTNALVSLELNPATGCAVVDSLPQLPLRSVK